jgi:dTDP-4-amino-4,6-dideoxygalactose transaminase
MAFERDSPPHRPISIPVLRSKLPSFTQLAPYLQSIDERRFYSNGGPLASKLQAGLSRHLGSPEDTLITAASGTAGITTALLALDLPPDSICLMPSWTFAATPLAALAAGMKPWFLDVERRTWALNPLTVSHMMARSSSQIGAVVVVSPFGAPIDVPAWEAFQRETGIAVVVDAAAGFDTVRFSSLISVVSMHATKVLAAGEGGFVISPDREMRDRVRACGNFGFSGSRVAQRRAINSKMSEYHAAVALASLDSWPFTRLRHLQIASWYRELLNGVPGVQFQPGYGDGWAGGTTNVLIESDSAESISRCLLRDGIETRMWWGTGCHRQPAFVGCGRAQLPETEFLAVRVLGLPHFVDMTKAEVSRVASSLSKALNSRIRGRQRAS